MSATEGFFFPEKTVFVVPVPRTSYQKRGNYTVISPKGTRLPANRQMARGVSRPFGFVTIAGNPSTLATGLDDHISNPYLDKNLEEIPARYRPRDSWENKFKNIKKEKTITRQMLYEIIDNVPEGFYTSKKNTPLMSASTATADTFKAVQPSFLEEFKIHLNEGTNSFSNTSQRGRLGIQILESHPKIALRKEDINVDIHDFYIASQEEVLEEQTRKDTRFIDVIVRLDSVIKDYDPLIAYQFCVAVKAAKGNISQKLAIRKLTEYVMEEKRINGYEQDQRWNMFNIIFNAFKDAPSSLYASYLIEQAFHEGIFKNVGGEIIWPSQRGRDNWYNLGANPVKLRDIVLNSINEYDPDLGEDNLFAFLEAEIKAKGILTR